MPDYVPTVWVDNQSPDLQADNLNHLEQGLLGAYQKIDGQNLEDHANVILTNPTVGQVLKLDASGNWVNAADLTGGGGGTGGSYPVIERNDIAQVGAASTIDFSTAFTVSESPSGEANIGVNIGTATGTVAAGDDSRIPSQTENDALQAISGQPTPNNSNRFATDQDSRLPTQAENDALQAITGRSAPTNTNRVVTDNDTRLSDARTPTTHASTHASGGSDPISFVGQRILWVPFGQNAATLAVQNPGNLLTPVTDACTVTDIRVKVKTAPGTQSISLTVQKVSSTGTVTAIGTVTIAATQTSGSWSGSVAMVVGDSFRFDITQVGAVGAEGSYLGGMLRAVA